MEKIRRWKLGMEEKGLKVNLEKTKVMWCSNTAPAAPVVYLFECVWSAYRGEERISDIDV